MAWRFEPEEGLRQAFCRVAAEEIARVRAGLGGSERDRDKAIHEARQGFKRLRALLRLAKRSLGSFHAGENRRWRDAGQLLSEPREATVLMQTFDKLVADCLGNLPRRSAGRLRAGLRASQSPPDEASIEESVQNVLGLLDAAERGLGKLDWPDDRDALSRGLKQSQARLRKSWKTAQTDPVPSALHKWRKRAKNHSAQLRLFRKVMPDRARVLRNQAKVTAELLGEEHDLWLLSERLSNLEVPLEAAKARAVLLDEIQHRRDALRRRAVENGEDFSAEKAKPFARTLVAAWEQACEMQPRKRRRKQALHS